MIDNKILIISGPTASGKTKLSLKLAKDFNGELISADSRQVYQGMDIVTGKDLPKYADFKFLNDLSFQTKSRNLTTNTTFTKSLPESLSKYNLGFYLLNNIPLWGTDLVKPDQSFDVSDFVKITRFIIKDIQKRNKLPIIVGGTAFYLKNLISPAETIGIPTNPELRQKLETLSLSKLQKTLAKLNPDKFSSMNNSDKNNPRRLIRAIEVSKSNKLEILNLSKPKRDNALWYSLEINQKDLLKKIQERVGERIKNGAIIETKKLLEAYSSDLPSMSAIGYQDIYLYIKIKTTLEDLINKWMLHETQYAKRQITFLKKISEIKWISLNKNDYYERIKTEITLFLTN